MWDIYKSAYHQGLLDGQAERPKKCELELNCPDRADTYSSYCEGYEDGVATADEYWYKKYEHKDKAMPDQTHDKEKLLNMKPGDTEYVNWFEEGGGEVEFNGKEYLLYEIPQYGGVGMLTGSYTVDEIDRLLNIAYSWT